ncbi:hypothetical protein H1196_16280 [Brevibacillus halotolerans]|nr:hypothetical protein [Brevibacillus halotolerans]
MHIWERWTLLGKNQNHKEALIEYQDKLMGKHLTGNEDVWKSLHFARYKEIRTKYIYKIPEKRAMGDALAIAYRLLKNQ